MGGVWAELPLALFFSPGIPVGFILATAKVGVQGVSGKQTLEAGMKGCVRCPSVLPSTCHKGTNSHSVQATVCSSAQYQHGGKVMASNASLGSVLS